MPRVLLAIIGIGLAATLTACAPEPIVTPTESGLPSIDPSLIPTAPPATVQDVSEAPYQTSYGDYIFKVGLGPVWCSVNTESKFVVCEQNEVTAQYEPIPVPSSCDFSYGYQVRLWATQPAEGEIAEFMCAGGSYADPSNAQVLNSGDRIHADGFTCWVDDLTARCENGDGNYVVLGPRAWALGS